MHSLTPPDYFYKTPQNRILGNASKCLPLQHHQFCSPTLDDSQPQISLLYQYLLHQLDVSLKHYLISSNHCPLSQAAYVLHTYLYRHTLFVQAMLDRCQRGFDSTITRCPDRLPRTWACFSADYMPLYGWNRKTEGGIIIPQGSPYNLSNNVYLLLE